jgi:hypothetical protein
MSDVKSEQDNGIEGTNTISSTVNQLTKIGSNFQDLLSNLDAEVETSKFVIQKVDDGMSIDIVFKAKIRSGKKNSKEVK